MTCKEKLERAMSLLERIEDCEIPEPDKDWYKEYYLLTGNHMIFTAEGWLSGESKEDYLDENGRLSGILSEVNAPEEEDCSVPTQPSAAVRASLRIVHRR